MPVEVRKMYQAEAKKSLEIAKQLRDDKDQPGNVRLRAVEFITEQAYGKAPQSTDITSGGEPLAVLVVDV